MKLDHGILILESKDYEGIKVKLDEGKSIQEAFESELTNNKLRLKDIYTIQTNMGIKKEFLEIHARIVCEVRTGRSAVTDDKTYKEDLLVWTVESIVDDAENQYPDKELYDREEVDEVFDNIRMRIISALKEVEKIKGVPSVELCADILRGIRNDLE